jgi:acyl carrier protein
MIPDLEDVKAAIRGKVIELAAALDVDASALQDDDIIPATGYLDSAAIMELVVWFDGRYRLQLAEAEINIDNLGSVDAMADFLVRRSAAGG